MAVDTSKNFRDDIRLFSSITFVILANYFVLSTGCTVPIRS